MQFTKLNQSIFCVLFMALCCHCSTSQDNKGNNVNASDDNSKAGANTTPLPIHKSRRDDVGIFSKDTYDYQEHGRLSMEVTDITTSSIHVKWSLPEMKFNDSVLESSTFLCESSSGLMISRVNATSIATYHQGNLNANTKYFVCVYMVEKSHFSDTKVLHYSCQTLKTEVNRDTPSLRTDSIVAVVITLGYIVVMVIIGYATWRWKKNLKEQDEAKQKLAIEDEDYDEDDGMINGHIRDNHHQHHQHQSGSGGNSRTGNGGGTGLSGVYHGVRGNVVNEYSSSVDDFRSQKEKDNMRSSNHGVNNTDRGRESGRGNYVDSVGISESDGCLQQRALSNSAEEEMNGCLDFKHKRNSRGSAVKLTDVSGHSNSMERMRPKSQSVEDSPVKVTEITF